MATKRSASELRQLLANAIDVVGDIPRDRLHVNVRDVEAHGRPPEHLTASVLVRFLPTGSPFCCGEPACYSRVFDEHVWEELGDQLRRDMGLKQRVTVQLDVEVEYYDGIVFTALQDPLNHR